MPPRRDLPAAACRQSDALARRHRDVLRHARGTRRRATVGRAHVRGSPIPARDSADRPPLHRIAQRCPRVPAERPGGAPGWGRRALITAGHSRWQLKLSDNIGWRSAWAAEPDEAIYAALLANQSPRRDRSRAGRARAGRCARRDFRARRTRALSPRSRACRRQSVKRPSGRGGPVDGAGYRRGTQARQCIAGRGLRTARLIRAA